MPAGFAALGHRVVAVEPTAALRTRAALLHPSLLIEWIDDCLPALPTVSNRGGGFDVVMLTAVWMHLDDARRRQAMPVVAHRLSPGGVMMLSLRHGPVPVGRRMFEVTAQETIELAAAEGLGLSLHYERQDGLLGRPGVSWTRLAFARSANIEPT